MSRRKGGKGGGDTQPLLAADADAYGATENSTGGRQQASSTSSSSTSSPAQDGRGRVCFVTGSTGFVALNIVDALLSRGWCVHALHRAGSRRAPMLDALPFADPTQASGRLVHVEGDLGMDAAEFAALVPRGCEVLFHVCHVAEAQTHVARGISAPGFQPEGAEEHARVNLVAMDNVIHAARKAGVRRIVYCSSWSSYGRQPAGKDVTEATESRAYDVVNASLCGCLGPASTPVPYFVCKLR